MRINNYNKFFAEVAKIMNTDVKAVKHLDGRYKVELANHVYLNVYRGVSGSLFIHDHRGIVRITSCYDFEDFKTLNDLYERLVTDYSESDTAHNEETEETEKVDIDETYTDNLEDCTDEFATQYAEETNRLATPTQEDDHDRTKYLMETHSFPPTHRINLYGMFPTIPAMYNNKCFCCPADRQGNRCGGKEWCKVTWKRYEAIIKPEWHNVSLATLANLDINMLDEKRQTYLSAFRDLQQTLSYLRKCKTQDTYDTCYIRYIKKKNVIFAENKISYAMYRYIDAKLSMQNVESGVWASKCEDATGYHESRRYNKSRV